MHRRLIKYSVCFIIVTYLVCTFTYLLAYIHSYNYYTRTIQSRMRYTSTVPIPLKYYRILSSDGSLRRIHYDFNIMVDHENLSETQRANGKPKRIDDDDEQEFDGELKMEVVEYGKEDEEEEVRMH